MTINDILSRLDGVKKGSGKDQYIAKCPVHGDTHQSLSVGVGEDGRILLNCFAGCETTDIVDALDLKMQDLFPEKEKTLEFKPEHFYRDENGNVIAKKERWTGIKKGFTWYRPDNAGGWIKGIGEGLDKVAISLYNLDSVMWAKPETPIYIVEGEKDVDTLTSYGLIATTTPNGANTKWGDPLYVAPFKDRNVYIIPDNDKAGYQYSQSAAIALSKIAQSIKLLDLRNIWPEIPEKADITDYISAVGWTKAKVAIDKLIETAPAFETEPVTTKKFQDVSLPLYTTNEKTGHPSKMIDENASTVILDRHSIITIAGKPWIYENGLYKSDEDGTILKTIIREYIPTYICNIRSINNIYQLIISDRRIKRSIEDINQYPESWINFKDCMLDIKTLEKHQHDPRYFAINQLPHNCPDVKNIMVKYAGSTVERFFKSTIPDEADRVMFFQYIGYCMTRLTYLQKFLILNGPGGTGKSTIVNYAVFAIGRDNVSHLALQLLTLTEGKFSTIQLLGKLLNACSDIPQKALTDTSVMKQATGEDMIKGEYKGGAIIHFRSYARLLFSANSIPLNQGENSNAFYRRMMILNINRRGNHIPDLEKALKKEVGIFIGVCALSAHLMCTEGGGKILESQNSINAVKDYRFESDPVSRFLAEKCTCGAGLRQERGRLYAVYCNWYGIEGEDWMSNKMFYRNLRDKGFDTNFVSHGMRYVIGLELKTR